MRICIDKRDNRILEMQSDATEGTLIKNAVNCGHDSQYLEEKVVTMGEYLAALSIDPLCLAEQAAQKASQDREIAKLQSILDNLPSWVSVKDSIETAFTGDQRTVVRKLARVIYWLARNAAD